MTPQDPKSVPPPGSPSGTSADVPTDDNSATDALRDLADVPAIEVVTTVALHLMSAAAVKVGLGTVQATPDAAGHDPAREMDLDEARTLIVALAGLITASAPRLGS
ncbi:MAG: sugar phosphate isomerase, partial [Actinomycetes bacterium]